VIRELGIGETGISGDQGLGDWDIGRPGTVKEKVKRKREKG